MIADVGQLGARWFYDWGFQNHAGDPRYVPMIWGKRARETVPVPALLAFNEPDQQLQARMSVGKAIRLWPRLMRMGRRLSSPATSQSETLGHGSWQDRFMRRAEARGYRVDFMAVHYYSADGDVNAFRDFLEQVHLRYRRPVWVTEWALADWADRRRFTAAQQRAFLEKGMRMMDDLPYVERHAWFGTYAELDDSHIASELIDRAGRPTMAGEAFRALAQEGEAHRAQCVNAR